MGIDLGTTYSAVSVMQNGKPLIIPVSGSRIVPSIVAYLPDKSILVGEEAKKQLLTNPLATYTSIKRIIGKTAEACVKEGIKIPNLDLRKFKKFDAKGSKVMLTRSLTHTVTHHSLACVTRVMGPPYPWLRHIHQWRH